MRWYLVCHKHNALSLDAVEKTKQSADKRSAQLIFSATAVIWMKFGSKTKTKGTTNTKTKTNANSKKPKRNYWFWPWFCYYFAICHLRPIISGVGGVRANSVISLVGLTFPP